MRPRARTALALAGLAAAAPVLAGCSSSALGQQAEQGDSKGYISGDGTRQQVPVAERGAPVELSGTTTDGSEVDLADWRGSVVVVNVWYAACGPCRVEAPDLAAVAAETAPAGVRFVGVNTEDDAGTAAAFERTFSIPYPSVLDAADGEALLALRGTVPPQAVPSTVILDTRGRPAARVLGRVEPDVLTGLVEDVLAEGPASEDAASEDAA